jgi:hypothetical protein
VLGALLGLPRLAAAQVQFGGIQGQIRDKDTGKPLGGVTISVTGPALQGEQTEITDAGGRYTVTSLPPGDNYVVRYYFNDVTVERPGIRIAQNRTLTISLSMPTQRGDRKVITIRERAPNVDTANANVGVEINKEVLENTAVRGRTYESVLALAPGSADVAPKGAVSGGEVGVSFNGSSGNENAFIIDGLNTTDPAFGLLSVQLSQYFIKEVNVVTGGYQAEYGRATGGVVSVVTKSGSNEFHGGFFGSFVPFQLQARPVARLGEALATQTRQNYQFDLGFDLGGPIVKDRVWFYVGFAPTYNAFTTDRLVRRQVYDPMTKTARIDPNYECPTYLSNGQLCDEAGKIARLTETVNGRSRTLDETQILYNWIAKLQFNLNPDHNISLGYIGSPEQRNEYVSYRDDVDRQRRYEVRQLHDVTARYLGKLFDRKLQLEVLYGFHYQTQEQRPEHADKRATSYRASASNPYSLADFENVGECQRDPMTGFNPCPITAYVHGGYGAQFRNSFLQRHMLLASATYFLRLLGNHAFKLGFDFEDNLSDNTRAYTGTDFDPNNRFSGRGIYNTSADGTQIRIFRGFGQPRDRTLGGDPGVPCFEGIWCLNAFRAVTETRNYAVYLRDSWVVGFLPGLTINAGVRWEAQEIFGVTGVKHIALYDNWSPRVGLVYDFTRKGLSKLYVNYGRFYESIPMDINDRAFSGEGLLVGSAYAADCPRAQLSPGGRDVVVPRDGGAGAPCTIPRPRLSGGGQFADVAPGLKGQFVNEVVAGFQYDVGLDLVLGVAYTFRNLGNIIEDLSVDGGNTYFIANPGAPPSDDLIRELEAEAKAARAKADQDKSNMALQTEATAAEKRLEVSKAVVLFAPPKRDYHAITILANKRLSNRFAILANYTYSRLIGNYPGTFSPYRGQLDPNISSQYDLIHLLVNRTGPLPNDRPHNFKLTGFYTQPIGQKGTLTAGLTFTLVSGRPIQVLGSDPIYGPRESFILPSGSGGRTPFITQFDLHVGYEHLVSKTTRLSVYADAVNLFNQREVINVDDEYTFTNVNPIVGGKIEDLRQLKSADGTALVPNSNYGQPTAYQAPLFMRFGARLSF